MSTTTEKAAAHLAAVRANVDAWYKDAIDYATFHARAGALHAAAAADGPDVVEAMSDMMLESLNERRAS